MRAVGMGVSTEAKAEDIIETLKAENEALKVENEALKVEAAKAKKAKEQECGTDGNICGL